MLSLNTVLLVKFQQGQEQVLPQLIFHQMLLSYRPQSTLQQIQSVQLDHYLKQVNHKVRGSGSLRSLSAVKIPQKSQIVFLPKHSQFYFFSNKFSPNGDSVHRKKIVRKISVFLKVSTGIKKQASTKDRRRRPDCPEVASEKRSGRFLKPEKMVIK